MIQIQKRKGGKVEMYIMKNGEINLCKRVSQFKLVDTSYSTDDVIVLLKDLTGEMKELSAAERERYIQNGVHYSEMLPEEKEPSKEYAKLYEDALERNESKVALHVATLASRIKKQGIERPIFVSLARAGIPVGVLLKRYFKNNIPENMECPHYAISIVRDRGIDENAMKYIYDTEIASGKHSVNDICFIDGWTGKGVINLQLKEAVDTLVKSNGEYWTGLRDDLYVLADPANVTDYCGTREDYLLPSACLNSTVSGLLSRTILNSKVDYRGGEFHGAVYFKKFKDIDKSNDFIDAVEKHMDAYKDIIVPTKAQLVETSKTGMDIVNDICEKYDIADYKKVKPGIGETTRVLLRRVPWKVIINTSVEINDPDLAHIVLLCKEKGIEIVRENIGNYKCCGVIKELSADA